MLSIAMSIWSNCHILVLTCSSTALKEWSKTGDLRSRYSCIKAHFLRMLHIQIKCPKVSESSKSLVKVKYLNLVHIFDSYGETREDHERSANCQCVMSFSGHDQYYHFSSQILQIHVKILNTALAKRTKMMFECLEWPYWCSSSNRED